MGNTIQKVAEGDDEVNVVETFDPEGGNYSSIADYDGDEVEIYVDFTVPKPEVVLGNVREASERGIDSVVGTTGWYDEKEEMEKIAKENDRRVLYASNFSQGTNLLFGAIEYLSEKLPEDWDASIDEKHHIGKADAPSGTAETLGDTLVENMPEKEKMAFERRDKRSDNEIDVLGARVGSVAGEHRVTLVPIEGYPEKLELTHNAYGTEVFAKGVLEGVKWLQKNRSLEPGLYNFKEDVMEL